MSATPAPFVQRSLDLMAYNPATEEEWAQYLAWQAVQPRGSVQTTQAWRIATSPTT